MSSDQPQTICDVHLHAEIESLKKALAENQLQLMAMETACLQESDRQVELEDSVIAWQDKYDRLYESHKRVQKVNQNLEDKLLKLVDRNSGERAQLTSDVATISVRLAQANYNIQTLQREIDRYKTDMSLAIQLLQCKPDSFVPQKITSLPPEIQSKVSAYMKLDTNSQSDSEGSTSGVGVATSKSYCVLPASESPPPVCPFPPTAMVYSMRGLDAPPPNNMHLLNNNIINNNNNNNNNNNEPQSISPAIMAKFLEDELKASETRHCDTCQCLNKDLTVLADSPKHFSIGTQTIIHGGETNNSLCLRCNSNLNSPSRTNSPYILKLVKSSDSVISETKSSVTDSTQNDKLFTPAKKDDLMVNPILGHHRLCDRLAPKSQTPASRIQAYSVKLAAVGREQKEVVKIEGGEEALLLSANNQGELDEFDDELGKLSKNSNNNNIKSSGQRIGDSSLKVIEKSTPQSQGGEVMTHGVGGSTNSLWSRTSSKEGIKMFESFNRNLIKTIKAENPKMSGPRMCKMVLQVGSNNILLDNTEDVTPIIYTRRERLLDDEVIDDEDEEQRDKLPPPITDAVGPAVVSTAEICTVPNTNVDTAPKQSVMKLIPTESSLLKNTVITVGTLAAGPPKVEERKLIDLGDATASPQKLTHTIKTQSTTANSVSSDVIVDLQESALLRRQQLSRVAEWVQNNSKLNVSERSGSNTSNENLPLDTSLHNNASMDAVPPVVVVGALQSNRQLNAQTSNHAHLLMLPSKVEQQQCTNGNVVTLSTPNGEFAQTSSSQNSDNLGIKHSHQSHQIPHQSKENVYEKFNYFHDKNNTTNIQQEQQPVDLAQMEYNVKQFLLKQNEWSIHNKATSPPTPSSRKISLTSSLNVSVSNQNLNIPNANGIVNSQTNRRVHRTETNL